MHYLLFYEVVEDYVERRAAFRSEHLAHARLAQKRGELLLAGALADPVDGAILLFRAESPAVVAAGQFASSASDTYSIIAKRYTGNGILSSNNLSPVTGTC